MKTAEALKTSSGLDEVAIEKLIDARNAARKTRNFKEADRIRDELKAMRAELEDHKDGTTTWKVCDDGARASEARAAAVPAG